MFIESPKNQKAPELLSRAIGAGRTMSRWYRLGDEASR